MPGWHLHFRQLRDSSSIVPWRCLLDDTSVFEAPLLLLSLPCVWTLGCTSVLDSSMYAPPFYYWVSFCGHLDFRRLRTLLRFSLGWLLEFRRRSSVLLGWALGVHLGPPPPRLLLQFFFRGLVFGVFRGARFGPFRVFLVSPPSDFSCGPNIGLPF
jgi:hypothetical protein